MTLRLVIVEDGASSELAFDRPVVSVGRALDNDVRLTSTSVSRHHCRIESADSGPWIHDLGSSNGTSVNGERVARRLLQDGDKLGVGGTTIVVHLEDERRQHETQAVSREAVLDEVGEEGYRTLSGEALRERDDLVVFARITRELARETELEPLLRTIVDSAVALFGAERGFLLLGEPSATGAAGAAGAAGAPKRAEAAASAAGAGGGAGGEAEMRVRVARAFDRSDIPLPRSRLSLGIARQVARSGRGLLSVDAGRDERFADMASVEDLRLRSVLCLPVRLDQRVEGVLYVDNRLQEQAFSQRDLELAELFADQAAIAIRNARQVAELRERNQRLESSRRQIELLNEQLGRKVRDRDTELAVVRAELGRERGRYDYGAIVGASDGMRAVFRQLDRLIDSDLPVLIQGESGTGKELIARAIHFNGPRSDKPFVSESCAALPDSLLESELFGHARGAFTGAHKAKRGLFEQAHGGTLFLDEIGEMSSEMQKKLLRVLQEGELRPVGSDQTVKIDVRLVSASNVDLEKAVPEGRFREDLFYRVNVLTVRLPPLRERREDVPLLAEALLARAAREASRPVPSVRHEVLGALIAYDWPGNVRELENEMRRVVLLAQEGEVRLEHLSRPVLERRPVRSGDEEGGEAPGDIKAAVADLERRSIEAALVQHGGNKSRAAGELGISRFALQRKLDKYGIEVRREGDGREDGEEDNGGA